MRRLDLSFFLLTFLTLFFLAGSFFYDLSKSEGSELEILFLDWRKLIFSSDEVLSSSLAMESDAWDRVSLNTLSVNGSSSF